MSSPVTLTSQVENLIHDTVCMELKTVDHRELESLAHSLRVDEAAEDIIALVEQSVARRLLDRIPAYFTGNAVREDLAAIGITVEEQVTA